MLFNVWHIKLFFSPKLISVDFFWDHSFRWHNNRHGTPVPDELKLNNQFPMQEQFMQQFESILKDQENTILAERLQQPGELRKIMTQQLNQLKEIHNQNPTNFEN